MTSGKIASIGIMMLLGFLLSLCSEADAFVAKGFMDNFGVAGVMAFLQQMHLLLNIKIIKIIIASLFLC